MEYTEHTKKYVAKLRSHYPDSDIPNDDVIEKTLSEMKEGEGGKIVERVVGDLSIRIWRGMVETEVM